MPIQRKPIGYVYRDEHELLGQAQTLEGRTARVLADEVDRPAFNASPKPVGKTGVGALVQLYMGRATDNRREPDFKEFGIELKTLPMKALGKSSSWTVKEPTSITMINYFEVDKEEWPAAYVRHKIDHVLWVPYEHDFEDKRRSRFRRAFLWKPEPADYPLFNVDYDDVRAYINQGRAHELSEAMSRILGARRKGSQGQMTQQPHSSVKAKSRAWAFKASYTRPILEKHVLKVPTVSLVEEIPALKTLLDVEPIVEARLGSYRGKTVDQIAKLTGARVTGGKSGPAAFVRKLLRVTRKGSIEEFEKLGIRVHTVWARTGDFYPWEAVSFPAMVLKEFVEEDWLDAEFADLVDHILFVPLLSETREAKGSRVLGRAFFWSPTPAQVAGIAREWKMHQRAVLAGKAKYDPVLDEHGRRRYDSKGRPMRENRLPKMEDTEFIHMRPHGLTSKDVDTDPKRNRVTKQCFWLNKRFLQTILLANDPR